MIPGTAQHRRRHALQGWCLGLLLFLACAGSATTSARTRVLLTVDVETLRRESSHPQADILGRLSGEERVYGVPLMLNMLAEHDAQATFYINVYEAAKFGDAELREVTEMITAQDQDAQLHTHPKPMYGKVALSSFDRTKQTEILQTGREMLREWGGSEVIAHRAGGYKADIETLAALRALQFRADSSLAPAMNSPLNLAGYVANDLFEISGLVQLPVTYYSQLRFGPWVSYRQIDIETSSFADIALVLDSMALNGACVVNIMAHSFSFTRSGQPDQRVVERFDQLLDFVRAHDELEFSTTADVVRDYDAGNLDCAGAPDLIPHTGWWLTYLRSWERFSAGPKYAAFALAPLIGLTLGLIALLLLIRRFR